MMNIQQLWLLFNFLAITTFPTYNMETEKETNPLIRYTKELKTFINKPSCVKFLPNNTVFINGSHGFILYNHETKKELIRQFRDYGFLDVATNTNKTKIAISADKKLIVYDAKTGNVEWQTDTNYLYFPITFNRHNENELISHVTSTPKIIFTSPTSCLEHTVPSTKSGPISTYPKYSEIIYPSEYSFTIFDCHDRLIKVKINGDFFLGAECSYDGKFIAANYKNDGCYLFNGNYTDEINIRSPLIKLCSTSKQKWSQAHYGAMAFHPNNTLALLSHNNILEFWHCDTSTLLKEIDLNYFDTLHINGTMQKRLDICPNGSHIIVALHNKCLILPIPFEALYPPGTTERLFTLYCLLRNYTDHDLPTDTIGEIINHYIKKTEKLRCTK